MVALDPVLIGLAFSAGMAAFLSPCSAALLPAYVGSYVGLGESDEDLRSWWAAALAGSRFGSAAAIGILGMFAVGGGIIYLLRTRMGLAGTVLLDSVNLIGVGIGVLILLLGILLLTPLSPSFALPVRAPERKTFPGMVAFGVLFAAASMGCTFPIFFAYLVQGIAAGAVQGVITFMAFGAGLAVLMFASGVLLSVAKEQAQTWLRRLLPHMKTVSGVLLIVAGLYNVYFYLPLLTF